jgi:transcriptional regulator with XRE-family HTH domain
MRLFYFSTRSWKMNTPDNEPLNKRLERLRKAQGLTAKAMAHFIEVPESTYREWEYGRGLKLPPFLKISQVLAISVTELVTGHKPDWQKHLQELADLEHQCREIRLKLSSLL